MTRWRWAVLAFSLIAATKLVSGASRLKFTDEYRVFVGVPETDRFLFGPRNDEIHRTPEESREVFQ